MYTCEDCGYTVTSDWMTHYCKGGETKTLGDKKALEAFIIHKDEEALKLLGKE